MTQIPEVSNVKQEQCYIHLSIMSDPYETLGHQYSAGFSKFSELMRQRSLPFNNIYPKSGGYLARQIRTDSPSHRVLTWEFSRRCHSFVTFPVPLSYAGHSGSDLPTNSIFDCFNLKLIETGFHGCSILNLDSTLAAVVAIIRRHRRLASQANIKGPFYVKAYLQNIWNAVPFIDLPVFLDHVSEFGIPLIEHTDLLVPNGTSLDTFIVLPESDAPESEFISSKREEDIEQIVEAFEINRHILEAFGIAPDVMKHVPYLIVRDIK